MAAAIRGSHAYADAGMYTVRVTLSDKDGGAATAVEAQVEVKIDEIGEPEQWGRRTVTYLVAPGKSETATETAVAPQLCR